MKILLTGASGFIGSKLVPILVSKGHRLILPLRKKIQYNLSQEKISQNITIVDIPDLTCADHDKLCIGVDAVIHTAGLAHNTHPNSEALYQKINHDLTIGLANAALRCGVDHFIFLSSVRAQVGYFSQEIVTENTQSNPVDNYGRSKLDAEQSLYQLKEMNVVSLRPVVVYGADAKGNVGLIDTCLRRGIPLPFRGIRARRSYLCIDRLMGAILFALENKNRLLGPYIVSDPEPMILEEFVNLLWDTVIVENNHIKTGYKNSNRPRIFSLSEPVLKLGCNFISANLWKRLGENLIVSSARFQEAGWDCSPLYLENS